jgi:hypothetical protein
METYAYKNGLIAGDLIRLSQGKGGDGDFDCFLGIMKVFANYKKIVWSWRLMSYGM